MEIKLHQLEKFENMKKLDFVIFLSLVPLGFHKNIKWVDELTTAALHLENVSCIKTQSVSVSPLSFQFYHALLLLSSAPPPPPPPPSLSGLSNQLLHRVSAGSVRTGSQPGRWGFRRGQYEDERSQRGRRQELHGGGSPGELHSVPQPPPQPGPSCSGVQEEWSNNTE